MIEVGDWVGGDVRESACHEHDETQNAQSAPEESGREARPPESAIQGEKVDNPQDEDGQVQAILYYARRPDLGEPHSFLAGSTGSIPTGPKPTIAKTTLKRMPPTIPARPPHRRTLFSCISVDHSSFISFL